MGLEFLDNPYSNKHKAESDFVVERDEVVIPLDVNLLINGELPVVWAFSDEESDDYPYDPRWEEDYEDYGDGDDIDNYGFVDDGVIDNDDDDKEDDDDDDENDDDFENADNEDYPQYNEIEDEFVHCPDDYENELDDFDDDDSMDYVTYPIDNQKSSEPSDKPSSNSTIKSDDANSSHNSESTANATATPDPQDD